MKKNVKKESFEKNVKTISECKVKYETKEEKVNETKNEFKENRVNEYKQGGCQDDQR